MSPSVFCLALGKALLRRPLSGLIVFRVSSALFLRGSSPAERVRGLHYEPTGASGGTGFVRPSLASIRRGRKTPKLLLALRDLSLAKDIPYTISGKTNLSHTNYRHPERRAFRKRKRQEYSVSKRKSEADGAGHVLVKDEVKQDGKPARPYYSWSLGEIQRDLLLKRRLKYKRRKRFEDEPLSLNSITREFLETTAWLSNCNFSPFSISPKAPRIYYGMNPDLVVIIKVFTRKHRWYLESKGYDPWDVLVWCWVLVAEDGKLAGLRLRAYTEEWGKRTPEEAKMNGLLGKNKKPDAFEVTADQYISNKGTGQVNSLPLDGVSSGCVEITHQLVPRPAIGAVDKMTLRPPPIFLILMLLRRKPLSRATLDWVLSNSPKLLSTVHPQEYKTRMLFLIRLLRRLQEEYITALPLFARIVTSHLLLPKTPRRKTRRTVTFAYNRLLALLARPPPALPFISQPLLQKAQFTLLQSMASTNIIITREGYRAIISVQLAGAKTPAERRRIKGMSQSWPPWQEERDAWTDKLDQGRITRAGIVLQQMKDAGYGFQEWEYAASTLAGTDTDLSPTIPTRTYLRLPSTLPSKYKDGEKRGNPLLKPDYLRAVWAARVRATRTIDEAWRCFLDARDILKHLDKEIYFAMFEKIIFANRLRRKDIHKNIEELEASGAYSRPLKLPEGLSPEHKRILLADHDNYLKMKRLHDQKYYLKKAVPGEGKEMELPPFSPSYGGVHVPIPPPSLRGLYQLMLRDGCEPSSRLIYLLVKSAKDLETAEALIGQDLLRRIWRVPKDEPRPSTHQPTTLSMKLKESRKSKRLVSKLLEAYLCTLIKCGHVKKAVRILLYVMRLNEESPGEKVSLIAPIWNAILNALIHWEGKHSRGLAPDNKLRFPEYHRPRQKAVLGLVWLIYKRMRAHGVEPDGETLRLMSRAAERVVELAYRIEQDQPRALGVMDGKADDRGTSSTTTTSTSWSECLWDHRPPHERVIEMFQDLVGLAPLPSTSSTAPSTNTKSTFTLDLSSEILSLILHYSSPSAQNAPPPLQPKHLPTPLYIPTWAPLHQYIRLLCLSSSYLPLLHLIIWMRTCAISPTLPSTLSSPGTPGEQRRMRKCFVPIRLFLESTSATVPDDDIVGSIAGVDFSAKCVRKAVRGEIERVDLAEGVWGGWAMDEEVRGYMGGWFGVDGGNGNEEGRE